MSELEELQKKWAKIEAEKNNMNKSISEAQQIAQLKKKIKDYEFSKTKTGAVVQNLKAVGKKILTPTNPTPTKKTKSKSKTNATAGLTMEDLMKM
jgi:hypothetical protein